MITFPNAKINIGLNITEKRSDGFHNLETVFYPVNWCEPLEIIIDKSIGGVEFTSSGISIDGNSSSNLCVKAYELLAKDFALDLVKIHLHKVIPIGAGLGGGSSDAAFTIKTLNELFELNLTSVQMQNYASKLGSDCAFFIENTPVFAGGKGDEFSRIELDLSKYFITLVKPPIHVSTAEAYGGIKPKKPTTSLTDLIKLPINEWKDTIKNDFEDHIFNAYPRIGEIKEELYKKGAMYASMSGSGSCVYGIFEKEVDLNNVFHDCIIHI